MKQLDQTLLAAALLMSTACFADDAPTNEPDEQDASNPVLVLKEVTVTGTYIRGVGNGASPLRTFDRESIERSGVATTHEFINNLPQNFRGGVSEAGGGPAEGLVQTGPGTGNNAEFTNLAFASGPNLHGLGTGSTLVLLDGKRIAPTDGGSSTDLLNLPLFAIEKIEVLSDSASALYGSDAVGGVINVHLRKDYSGQQTRVRYGSATDGGGAEKQASQTFGRNWGSGSALLSAEYYERGLVDANDRKFTGGLPAPTYLLPETDRYSVLATGRQEIASLELFGTGLYSKRLVHSKTSNDVGPQLWVNDHHGNVEQFSLQGGGSIHTGETWLTSLTLNYSSNDTNRRQEQLAGGVGSATFLDEERTSVKSADVNADGTVFEWRGQEVKAAMGAHYRREAYGSGGMDAGRHSTAVFGEILVPFAFGSDPAESPRVQLSLAGRYEDYSDFGDSRDPKVGLVFVVPRLGVNVRSTWGTSFRAPSFPQLNGPVQGLLFPIPAATGGMTLAAFAIGSNPDLQPEEAETFTAGFDIRPNLLPGGFSMSATYFDINDRHRIEPARALFDALVNPQYAGIVDETPDPGFLAFLAQQPESFNPTGSNWLSAQVLVDNRFLNISKLKVTGVDLLLNFELPLEVSQLSIGLDSTYLLTKDIQLSGTSPRTDVLNTVDNPVDLRMRGSVAWHYGAWSVAAFANYVDSYNDSRTVPAAKVSSWTTLDLSLRYRLPFTNSWIGETKVALIGQNVLGKDPPLVRDLDVSRRGGVHFDAANASAIGPTVAVEATVNW